MYPLRFPFQKKVMCPNLCVSEHAYIFTPDLIRNSDKTPLMSGFGQRDFFGTKISL